MINEALYEYYERHKEKLPLPGYGVTSISYVIYLHKNGTIAAIRDWRTNKNGRDCTTASPVPRGNNVVPNCMFDKAAYVFGLAEDGERKIKQLQSFIEMVETLAAELPDNEYAKAVKAFYDRYRLCEKSASDMAAMFADVPFASDMLKSGNISFAIQGYADDDTIAASDDDIIKASIRIAERTSTVEYDVCMLTGETGPVARIHNFIKFPSYEKDENVKIVSFQENAGVNSQGLHQGANAPMSKYAMHAYTSALSHLLRFDSPNMRRITENMLLVFWASGNSRSDDGADAELREFLGFGGAQVKDASPVHLNGLLDAVRKGEDIRGDDDMFYIAGLDNNSSRLMVRYWAELTPREFAANILRHYDDTRVDENGTGGLGMYAMLSAVAIDGKVSKLPSPLCESLLHSIINGTPYPTELVLACLNRLDASASKKFHLTKARAGILMGYINRNTNHQKLSYMLDTTRTDVSYLCGRLLAVCARMQYMANGQNSILTDHWVAASTIPQAAFANITDLSIAHYKKLIKTNPKAAISLERMKTEICDAIGTFPLRLAVNERSEFSLGYYQQKQAMFKKEETAETATETAAETDEENENENE